MCTFRGFIGKVFALLAWAVLFALPLASPPPGFAQSVQKPPRVGVIFNSVPISQLDPTALTSTAALAIQSELTKSGWKSGQNVEILWRSAESDFSRFPAIIEELLRRRVDVIVVGHNELAEEVRKKTQTVPIVLSSARNLTRSPLVSELARPGGNVTGVELIPGIELFMKRLEVLRELVPGLSRVAHVWWEPGKRKRDWGAVLNPVGGRHEAWEQSANRDLVLMAYQVASVEEVEAALVHAKRMQVQAVLVDDSPPFYNPANQRQIHEAAKKHRIAVMHTWLSGVETGGLIAYGIEPDLNFRKAGYYVARLLKGDKAADLPIERLTNYQLYVNKSAAQAIGVSLPESILVRADKLIE